MLAKNHGPELLLVPLIHLILLLLVLFLLLLSIILIQALLFRLPLDGQVVRELALFALLAIPLFEKLT